MLKARRTLDNDNPHVFASRGKTAHIMDPRAALERFAKHIGMERLSAYVRRTYVDIGVTACGLYVAKLELLTNHLPQGVTQKHYLKTSNLRAYHREAQAIGDYIQQQAQIAAGANVVPLRV